MRTRPPVRDVLQELSRRQRHTARGLAQHEQNLYGMPFFDRTVKPDEDVPGITIPVVPHFGRTLRVSLRARNDYLDLSEVGGEEPENLPYAVLRFNGDATDGNYVWQWTAVWNEISPDAGAADNFTGIPIPITGPDSTTGHATHCVIDIHDYSQDGPVLVSYIGCYTAGTASPFLLGTPGTRLIGSGKWFGPGPVDYVELLSGNENINDPGEPPEGYAIAIGGSFQPPTRVVARIMP